MKVRILGCGTSTGVPKIGNDWGKCDPDEPRNEARGVCDEGRLALLPTVRDWRQER